MNRRPSQYVLENPEETLLSFHLLACRSSCLEMVLRQKFGVETRVSPLLVNLIYPTVWN